MDGAASNQRHLGDYLALLKRQRVFLVICLVLGIVLGVVALNLLAPTYKSTAAVLVEATTGTTQASDARTNGSSVNMDTEAQVVKSLPVASEVKTAMGSTLTPAQLASRVQVTIPANTTILDIGFSAPTAAEAQRGAQAFADSYLAYRTSQAEEKVAAQIEVLDQQATDVAAQTRSVNDTLSSLPPSSSRRDTAEQTLRGLRTRARWIDEQLLPLETAQTDAGSVIVSAPRPGAPASPNQVLVMGSSIVLMLLLGFSVVWWRDRSQGRIRAGRELEDEYRVPVLGAVGEATLGSPDSPGRTRSLQQYRQLVHAIQARLGDGPATVLISGVGGSPVAGRVAHTLGAAVARTGTEVTLVYPDEETARTHSRGASHKSSRLETTSLEAAHLVVDGDVQNRGLGEYLTSRTSGPDRLVLMATPPMGESADAQAIAPHVRLTVLVVDLDRSTHDEVGDALRQLRQVETAEVGALVVSGRRLRWADRLGRRRSRSDAADDLSEEDLVTARSDAPVKDASPAKHDSDRPAGQPLVEAARDAARGQNGQSRDGDGTTSVPVRQPGTTKRG